MRPGYWLGLMLCVSFSCCVVAVFIRVKERASNSACPQSFTSKEETEENWLTHVHQENEC